MKSMLGEYLEGVVTIPRRIDTRLSAGYVGLRENATDCIVWSYNCGRWQRLPLYLGVRNHSPAGFNWGYGGSGPAQLALALLMHAGRSRAMANRGHQDFKFKIVGRLHHRRWHLSQRFVLNWMRQYFDGLGQLTQLNSAGRMVIV